MRALLRLLGRLVRALLLTLGTLALVLLVVAATSWALWRGAQDDLPPAMVLVADLREPLPETAVAPALRRLGVGDGLSISDAVLALEAASNDPRVKGLVARVDEGGHGLAVAQELRDAVGRFRSAGKPAVAHADTFGELGPGNEGYYLATAFERVELQPVGLLGFTGLLLEVPHLKELMDQLGVRIEVARRAEYKSALEPFTQTSLTATNREQLEALLGDLGLQLRAGVAAGRELAPERVRELVDAGPYTGGEALGAGLVDALQHFDETLDAALGQAGPGAGPVDLARYAEELEDPDEVGARIALVRATGPIVRGEGNLARIAAADTLVDALEEAIEDPAIDAILLRVSSPGGSAVASESVGRMVRKARAAGKPVVASMGNTAASGGYWIAMDADRIVALPATLTGSIGVVAGKPVLAGALDKLGINLAELGSAANADFWSLVEPYSPAGRARLETILDDLYGQFVDGAARGRRMPPAAMERLARGRIWSGAMAKERGLVDRLGGLSDALRELKGVLGLPEDAFVALEPLPKPKGALEQALELVSELPGMSGLKSLLAGLDGPASMQRLWLR